mmetsp:Transcript_2152/g.3537  ORF Transcript_2152/g.3537 Transcript_2152/m.3537 type:complete len:423 (-) Transcript_2152:123-1391(-)
MMRAAVYDRSAPEGIRVVENRTRPTAATLQNNHVLVRVAAAGVNPVDAKRVFGDKLPAFLEGVVDRLVDGHIAGFDFAGVVEAVGVRDINLDFTFSPGDEVFGIMPPMQGSFAEVLMCPADQLCAKPKTLTMVEAAALPLVGITAIQLFEEHHLADGQRVLMIGATGGVGHVATQVAVAMGASVVGVCSYKNAGIAKQHGCTAVLAYDADDKESGLVEALQAHCRTFGPFHLVVDTVTSSDERDVLFGYPSTILACTDPAIVARPGTKGGVVGAEDGWTVDQHNYVTIGSSTIGWAKAGFKKVTGWNTFPSGRDLFWITPEHSAPCLRQLKRLCERDISTPCTSSRASSRDGTSDDDGGDSNNDDNIVENEYFDESRCAGVYPMIASIVPLTSEGLATAFKAMHSRRSKGKYVVDCSSSGTL